jgi:hypothetical protein
MKLRNGASVIMAAPYRLDNSRLVVLARWGEDLVSWHIDEDRNAYWGYYGMTALPKFCERTGIPQENVQEFI